MCSGVLNMIPSNLKNWRIFSLLKPEFISAIRMVYLYGDSGNKALIVTQDEMVYALGINTIHRTKIDKLCKKGIQTFAWFQSNNVLVLTKMKEFYLWDENVLYTFSNLNQSWSKIACGGDHAYGLTWTGDIYSLHCSGVSCYGDCPTWDIRKETNILSNKRVTHISCGRSHNIVMTYDRKVYSWGANNVGQLGIQNYEDQSTPVEITQLQNLIIEKIVCGYAHNIALSNKGVLYVWGANDNNQLGIHTGKSVSRPTKLVAPSMGTVIDIAASRYSHISVAMANGSQIFIWGTCLEQSIKVPMLTQLRCLHDAFACFASPRNMHEPLLIQDTTDSNLVDSFKKFFDDPNTSDVIFKVHGKPIHVHKTVLKIRSSYFRTMFQGEWMETSQRVIEHEVFSYETYRAYLKYLYTNEIDVPSSTAALDLLPLADIYNEDRMKILCVQFIQKKIAVNEVASVYKTSIEYDIKELEEFCFHFALRHMTEVVQTTTFIDLDETTVKNFIIKAAKTGAFKT